MCATKDSLPSMICIILRWVSGNWTNPRLFHFPFSFLAQGYRFLYFVPDLAATIGVSLVHVERTLTFIQPSASHKSCPIDAICRRKDQPFVFIEIYWSGQNTGQMASRA